MKLCRRGFIRWRRREGPEGCHHDEARAEKCDISVGSTELDGEAEREREVVCRERRRSGRRLCGRERMVEICVRGGMFSDV